VGWVEVSGLSLKEVAVELNELKEDKQQDEKGQSMGESEAELSFLQCFNARTARNDATDTDGRQRRRCR
jgi:hypothetical protein